MDITRRQFAQGLVACAGAHFFWSSRTASAANTQISAAARGWGALPTIPGGFPLIFYELLYLYLIREFGSYAAKELPALLKKLEDKFTKELLAAQAGGDVFGLPVTDVDAGANTVTLLLSFKDVEVPLLRGLKLGLARGEFVVERAINLTDASNPPIKVKRLPSYALELDFAKQDNYEIRLGYAYDESVPRESQTYLVGLTWHDPRFRLFGLLADTPKGGILIDVRGDSPFALPLGTTGLGLNGVGVLYGEYFAPLFDSKRPQTAAAQLESADASTYGKWALAPKNLDSWIAVPDRHCMYGLSTSIVDLVTGGWAVNLRDAGLAYLTFGPTIVFGGELRLLDTISAGQSIGAIDIRSKSVFAKSTSRLNLVGEDLVVEGSSEFFASLSNPARTYVAVGGFDMTGCHVKLKADPLALEMRGGARVIPAQGAAASANARLRGEGEICGFGGGFELSLDVLGGVGWNPIAYQANVEIGGSAWIKALGVKLGAGISTSSELILTEPLVFGLRVTFVLKLPWPLSDQRFPVDIFHFEKRTPADPTPPLKIAANQNLSFVHPPSGMIGDLEKANGQVWPDIMFAVDFQRAAGPGQLTNIVNPVSDRSLEAGVDVWHSFHRLAIQLRDPQTASYTDVPAVRASWLHNARNDISEQSTRLAIPCNDPLSWLNRFEHAQPKSSHTARLRRFQTFGFGPGKLFEANPGPAIATFNEVEIQSVQSFWLFPLQWSKRYGRAIAVQRLEIRFVVESGGTRELIPTEKVELRIVGRQSDGPRIGITGGQPVAPRIVRVIEGEIVEWAILITRTEAESRDPIALNDESGSQLVAVAYTRSRDLITNVPDQSYLGPGHYRVQISGRSKAAFRGTSARNQSDWSLEREFDVIAPPLRPYLRYSTLGDERIFGLHFVGWNPNPPGLGFGHYSAHFAQIRARVAYLSKIYPKLFLQIGDGSKAFATDVLPCIQGTVSGSNASQEWRTEVGLPTAIEEEMTFEAPNAPGPYTIEVFRPQEGKFEPGDKIDQWDYRVSTYSSPDAQLQTKNLLSRQFGSFGSRQLTIPAQKDLPKNFDFDALPKSQVDSEIHLPLFFNKLFQLDRGSAALSFLQVLEWCHVFSGDPPSSHDRIFAAPLKPDLSVVCDTANEPVALLLRTGEPCDWRRVEVLAAQIDLPNKRAFDVTLVPSTDGCQCLFILRSDNVAVRIPSGRIGLRIRFKLEAQGLPRLTPKTDPSRTVDEMVCNFLQPFGALL